MRITINKAAIMARVEAGKAYMIPAVGEQALADCQEYVPQDQNVLRATAAINTSLSGRYKPDKKLPLEKQAILSSAEGSDLKKGRIVWDTPYAKKRYHVGAPSHDKNKKASILWCEVAKNKHLTDWKKIAQKSFTRGFNGERL